MDISSTHRLAAYTRDLGIDRSRAADTPKSGNTATPAASPSTKGLGRADIQGVRVSLSANAETISKSVDAQAQGSGDAQTAVAPREPQQADRGPKTNRSLAIEAYQKNVSAVSGSRIQVIA